MYCKFEIALSLAVIYVVCVKKNIFFFTCYLLKFFNFFFFLCLIFALFVVVFLLELFDRHGFDNHAYLFDDISRNRKKSYCLVEVQSLQVTVKLERSPKKGCGVVKSRRSFSRAALRVT